VKTGNCKQRVRVAHILEEVKMLEMAPNNNWSKEKNAVSDGIESAIMCAESLTSPGSLLHVG
jgi:hypothetical protein